MTLAECAIVLLGGVQLLLVFLLYRKPAADAAHNGQWQASEQRDKAHNEGLHLALSALRTEAAQQARLQREEVNAAQQGRQTQLQTQLKDGLDALDGRLGKMEAQFKGQYTEGEGRLRADKEEGAKATERFFGQVKISLDEGRTQQNVALQQNMTALTTLSESQEKRHDALRNAVEVQLSSLRHDNEVKLEQMRLTVDEKLRGTLEKRMDASFTQIRESLERAFQFAGELQSIGSNIGDLKRVLTNVKVRGTWGEFALGTLLEQTLTADQFAKNVEIEPGSGQRVEFAVRLPQEGPTPLWLPIDSKMPNESYERLTQAAERSDAQAVEEEGKALERAIRVAARDIHEKYIHPPHSTDFAILFLPTEGLFAEVVRRPGLVGDLQLKYRISIAGPITLSATLNALRMGFRSLAIQKRTSEVWEVLGAVKTEFNKFGGFLDKVQQKIEEAGKVLEQAGTRRKAMDRKLRVVESLPEDKSRVLLAQELLDEVIGSDVAQVETSYSDNL